MKKTPTRRKKTDPLSVQTSEVVAEVRIHSPDLIRLSRVKYEGNDYTFVDIRLFRRGYDDEDNEVFYPSTKGLQMKESDFLKLIAPYLQETVTPLREGKVH